MHRFLKGQPGPGDVEELVRREEVNVVRQHRHPVRCLHHGQRRLILEQLDGLVLARRFEVLDDHKGHPMPGGEISE